MNDLVDDLLSMIKPTLAEQLEPFKLPETTHGFSKDVLGISGEPNCDCVGSVNSNNSGFNM